MKCSTKVEHKNINLRLDLEAWTQSLVIDFWRSAPSTLTLATLQEYDLVMKKCQGLKLILILVLKNCWMVWVVKGIWGVKGPQILDVSQPKTMPLQGW